MKVRAIDTRFVPEIFQTPRASVILKKLMKKSGTEEFLLLGVPHESSDVPNLLVIDDWVIPEQVCTSTKCKLAPNYMEKLLEEQPQYRGAEEGGIVVWFHSHVNMGVTPSGQDDVESLSYRGLLYKYVYMIIANKRKECSLALYDFEQGRVYSELELKLLLDEVDTTPYEDFYDANISEAVVIPVTRYSGGTKTTYPINKKSDVTYRTPGNNTSNGSAGFVKADSKAKGGNGSKNRKHNPGECLDQAQAIMDQYSKGHLYDDIDEDISTGMVS